MSNEYTITAEIAPQGQYIALKTRGAKKIGGGRRGDVCGFSRASRSRLLSTIAKLNKNHIPVFVTLTYPEKFPSEVSEYKYHLKLFFQRIKYVFPEYGAIWKLEYQKRGAAHYHILLWGVRASHAADLIPCAWHEIAGDGDTDHLAFHQGELQGSEHCVQPVRSWRGVVAYAAKYIGKEIKTNQPTGRIWGVRGKLPKSPIFEIKLDMRSALEYRRTFRKMSGYGSNRFGFWGFTNDPANWFVFLQRLFDEQEKAEEGPPLFPTGWYKSIRPPQNEDDFF